MPPKGVTGSTITMLNDTCRQPDSAHPAGPAIEAKEKKMPEPRANTRRVRPTGRRCEKDGEKWTPHSRQRTAPLAGKKVWQALTDPAHLREWASLLKPMGAWGTVGNHG